MPDARTIPKPKINFRPSPKLCSANPPKDDPHLLLLLLTSTIEGQDEYRTDNQEHARGGIQGVVQKYDVSLGVAEGERASL